MKQQSILFVIMLLVTTSLWSCAKTDGYYDYENKENIFTGNTIEYFQSKPQVYDSLLTVLNKFPALRDSIATTATTVFAPTNSSFHSAITNLNLVRKTQNKPLLYIRDLDPVQLDTLISKYISKDLVTTDSMLFVDGLFINARYNQDMHAQRIKQESSGFVGGGLVTVYYSDTKGSNFQSQWTRTTTQAVNIKTSNGVVHILNNGHEFGFGEFLTRFNK
ncbi:hypothetical protein ACR782_14195 [Sphingobacterium spiritivorum]|uniref:hypothetical protein n=1 Tax=Sphingobacterium spiritivorum TaxID=258 RepID=UPI003DA46AB2